MEMPQSAACFRNQGDMLVQVNLYFTQSVFLCKMLRFLNMDLLMIVLLDMLSYSAAILSVLERHPVSTGKELISAVETFILELFNLIKDSILEAYCSNTKSNDNGRTEKDIQSSFKESDNVNYVISVAKCTVENLVELGILVANAGGNLVTILNLSWK
ncbi:hypothetical protein Tco_0843721 [Tanacetum coccineum]